LMRPRIQSASVRETGSWLFRQIQFAAWNGVCLCPPPSRWGVVGPPAPKAFHGTVDSFQDGTYRTPAAKNNKFEGQYPHIPAYERRCVLQERGGGWRAGPGPDYRGFLIWATGGFCGLAFFSRQF